MKTRFKNVLCCLALTGASTTFAADFPNAILADGPLAYVCGPTSFVESVASGLVGLGYPAERIKTERFGATGQ